MTEIASNEKDASRCMILVHGKDFKPTINDYFDLASAAIRAGLERDFPDEIDRYRAIPKRIAYYGDITNELLSGMNGHFDEVLDVGDRRNALAQLRILDRRKQFGVSRYDRLPGKTAAAEFAVDIVTTLQSVFRMSKPLLARIAKDVEEYWYGGANFADSIRARVRHRICEALDKNEKILLISHGTGCIITYDVLWQLSHEPEYSEAYGGQKIDTWVTLGAPMGDSLVRKRLLGAQEKGRRQYPSNVLTWNNVAAEDDYMCHDNTLADDFKAMLKQRMVSSIRDYKIYNLCVRYGKSNPHSSLGYYIHPRLAQIVVEWLKFGPGDVTGQNIL